MEEGRYYRPVPKDLDNAFRKKEKFYRKPPSGIAAKKSKKPIHETDFSEVIDFANINNNSLKNRDLIIDMTPHLRNPLAGDDPNIPSAIKFFGIKNIPGLLFIPNPFQPEQQIYWANECVREYTLNNPTNVVNIEMIRWREQNENFSPEEEAKHEQSLFMKQWNSDKMKNIRWATVGYHFQWTKRVYQRDKKGSFPPNLRKLCKQFAHQVGYDMEPEAATLNFYSSPKYLMGGHVDDAEENMEKPIVSVSFGNTVVFLIGGTSREVEPTALYIRSGDIVIMGGESRNYYHGVPRMIENTSPSYFLPDSYIATARINVNCRQVF